MTTNETRLGKITKRSNAKKPVFEVIEVANASTDGSASPDGKQQAKRVQGIVINGKTYTCATCKTGHRVGICKHARDRPMKPTHPPGRPPAGAPKKVICDCPKSCSCTKKDCRCVRNCSCTQPMYMLVYVPAPEEDENAEEEKGEWKLGEQVTTDLKGNVLTPEEVMKRRQQKDSMKSQHTSLSSTERDVLNVAEEIKPEPVKSCCKHKETVTTRNIAAQALPQSETVSRPATDGCNCGHTCTCAFCPQHPNNSTSTNVARQQAMHFASHEFADDQQIVPFLPTLPQGMSCMGGQPRFAISRNAVRPSYDQMQKTFPNPGYIIAYPFWSNCTNADASITPFPNYHEQAFVNNMNMTPILANATSMDKTPICFAPPRTPMEQASGFDFSNNQFGIGNAFVASAGNSGWDTNVLSPDLWSMDIPSTTMPFDNMADSTAFMASASPSANIRSHSILQTPQFPSQDAVEVLPDFHDLGGNLDLSTMETIIQKPVSLPRGCCHSINPIETDLDSHTYPQCFSTLDPLLTINKHPHLNGMG